MKIHYKKLLALSLVVIMCCILCACGIIKKDAVGTWRGSYVYNGNNFTTEFVLDSNGEYYKVTYKNGSLSSSEDGTWEVKVGKVILHEDGNMGMSLEFKYKGDALVNNDHYFYKSN